MLDSLTKWGRRCGLKFNPEKSVAVVFTRSNKLPQTPLKIDGKDIAYKKEVKYLGVTLDSKLHWKPHIDEKIKKAKRFISQVASITRNNWGPKPTLMRWSYLSIVRPMLCYGSMIWGHRAPFHITRLRRLNRMAINTFGNFPKSTPTAALEVMLDVLPLHLHCQQEGLAALSRLNDVVSISWPGTSARKTHAVSHLRHWNRIIATSGLNLTNTDRCSTTRVDLGFKINRDSFGGHSKHRTPTQYNIYTDGSRLGNQTGAGYTIQKGKQEIARGHLRLPDESTVFQAEVTAITQAALRIIEIRPRDLKFIKIFVDSQAAIQALGNPSVRSKTVGLAIDTLNNLAKLSLSTTITWIPAHKGHLGNETADSLAKAGSELATVSIQTPKPHRTVISSITNYVYQAWTNEWRAYSGAQHTKYFYSAPSPQKARYVYKLARLELGRFARLITGHNNLNGFQTKIGLWNQDRCRLCLEESESYIHFATSCPRLRSRRTDLFGDTLPDSDMQWSVRTLIDFSYTPTINDAFEGTWAHETRSI